jgi:hypothetical protein
VVSGLTAAVYAAMTAAVCVAMQCQAWNGEGPRGTKLDTGVDSLPTALAAGKVGTSIGTNNIN